MDLLKLKVFLHTYKNNRNDGFIMKFLLTYIWVSTPILIVKCKTDSAWVSNAFIIFAILSNSILSPIIITLLSLKFF